MGIIKSNNIARYLVPFYCDFSDKENPSDEYVKLCDSISTDALWKNSQFPETECDTFEYLYSSVYSSTNNTGIGRSWNLHLDNREISIRYKPSDKEDKYSLWKVTEAGVFLFRTGIGFLWYEISNVDDGATINTQDFILFQNRFKEINRSEKYFEVLMQDSEEYKPLFLSEVIVDTLKGFYPGIKFLNGRKKRDIEMLYPDKALIFNLVILRDKMVNENGLHELAFRLANGYTNSYRGVLNKEDVVTPFSDVCWYASRGGCGYYAVINNDNEHFFNNYLQNKVRTDYFLMYILALYQSYSLLNYIRRITVELSADASDYLNLSDAGKKLDMFLVELNVFLMKGIYTSVSSIQHQNDFYDHLLKRLKVKEDAESVGLGLNSLAKVQRIYSDKEEQAAKEEEKQYRKDLEALEKSQEAKREKKLTLTLSVLSVLSVFSAFMDSYVLIGVFEDVFKTFDRTGNSSYFELVWQSIIIGAPWTFIKLFAFVLIAVLTFVCIINIFKNFFELRK